MPFRTRIWQFRTVSHYTDAVQPKLRISFIAELQKVQFEMKYIHYLAYLLPLSVEGILFLSSNNRLWVK